MLCRCDNNQLTAFRSPPVLRTLGLYEHLNAVTKARAVYIIVALLTIEECMRRVKANTNWLMLYDTFITSSASRPGDSRVQLCKWSHGLRCVGVCLPLACALLSKVQNIPVIAVNVVLERLVFSTMNHRIKQEPLVIVPLYVTFATNAFYALGNSNLISTIDVAAGYVGLTSYSPIVVGTLMMLNTYGVLVYWIVMLFVRLDEHSNTRADQYLAAVNSVLMIRATIVCVYQSVAVALQNHLFIWSVICPKLLYETCTTLLMVFVAWLLFALRS